MPKFKNNHEGKQFRLLYSLQTADGSPHPHAGEIVNVVDRLNATTYLVETYDGTRVEAREEEWGPKDVDAAMAGASPVPSIPDQLQLINLYTDPATNVIQMADLDSIDDSPFQPRTHYPEAFIEGMAESMKAVGILQAMLVRRKADGRLENIFGHCRKRAGIKAGLKQGPVIVRELTDAESAQLQAVENLQRENLDAFDEALSFQAYIRAHNCTKDEFCKRTGLSRSQVYNRLKLATLHADGQAALRDKKISSEVATLIARVPNDKHQSQALKMVLENTYAHTGTLLPVLKARDMLREKFTLGLKDVLWDLDDAELLPEAGSCTGCTKRSGGDPIIFTDLLGDKSSYRPKGENVCTDPMCFDHKKTAQLKVNQAELEAKGKVVISGNKARNATTANGELKGDFIPLSEVRAAIKKAAGKGAEAAKVETITIQNPRNGKTIEAVRRTDLVAAGVIDAAKSNVGKSSADLREAQHAKGRAELEFERTLYAAALKEVRAKAASTERSLFDMRLIAQVAFGGVEWDDQNHLAELYGENSTHGLGARIEGMNATELALFMLDCALVGNLCPGYIGDKPDYLLAAAEHYGVDLEVLREQMAEVKPEAAQSDQQSEEQEA